MKTAQKRLFNYKIFFYGFFFLLSIFTSLLSHIYATAQISALKMEVVSLSEIIRYQQFNQQTQNEMMWKFMEITNSRIVSLPSLSEQTVLKTVPQVSSYPYLPYVLLGLGLILAITCLYLGSSGAFGPSGGGVSSTEALVSTSRESTNILGHTKNAVNNTAEVFDNMSAGAVDASVVLKNVTKTDGYQNMSEAVVNGTSGLNGFAKTFKNGSEFTENVSGGLAEGSAFLKNVTKTEGYQNISEGATNVSSMFKSATKVGANVMESLESGTETALDITTGAKNIVNSAIHAVGDGVNNIVGNSLTFPSQPAETKLGHLISASEDAGTCTARITDTFGKDLSGFSVVGKNDTTILYYNSATSEQVLVHQDQIVSPFVAAPLGALLPGGADLFQPTAAQELAGAAASDTLDPARMVEYLSQFPMFS